MAKHPTKVRYLIYAASDGRCIGTESELSATRP